MSIKADKLKVQTAFLAPMARARLIPTDDMKILVEEELARYGEAVLRDAASHIIRTRQFSTFPTIGEIIKAVKHATENPSAANLGPNVIDLSRSQWQLLTDQFGIKRWLPPSYAAKMQAEKEAADRRIPRYLAAQRVRNTGPLAKQALEEEWLHGLIDFVEIMGRMPDQREQNKLRNMGGRIRENLSALADLPPPPKAVKGWATLGGSGMVQSLRKMRQKMLEQAKREVFG